MSEVGVASPSDAITVDSVLREDEEESVEGRTRPPLPRRKRFREVESSRSRWTGPMQLLKSKQHNASTPTVKQLSRGVGRTSYACRWVT